MTTQPQTSPMTQTPPAHSAPKSKLHGAIGALLPFIGIILFLFHTVVQLAGGLESGWQKVMLGNAVTYLIGWAMLGGGIAHLFFGQRISKTIGFAHNEFQFEVGAADFSMGLVALLAMSYSTDYWWAIILVSSLYRVICGFGHIRSMIRDHNFATNNTLILIINFVVPTLLIVGYLSWI